MSRLQGLKETFKDRNGKLSSKRLWGAVTLCNGLLMAWSSLGVKVLILLGYIITEKAFIIDTTLIIGIVTAGAGLFVSTYAERQNSIVINQGNREDEGLSEM
jgi:hypothetical protein